MPVSKPAPCMCLISVEAGKRMLGVPETGVTGGCELWVVGIQCGFSGRAALTAEPSFQAVLGSLWMLLWTVRCCLLSPVVPHRLLMKLVMSQRKRLVRVRVWIVLVEVVTCSCLSRAWKENLLRSHCFSQCSGLLPALLCWAVTAYVLSFWTLYWACASCGSLVTRASWLVSFETVCGERLACGAMAASI